MIEKCVIATAQLAKHQMTWLRGSLSKDDSALVKKKLLIGYKNNENFVLDGFRQYFETK